MLPGTIPAPRLQAFQSGGLKFQLIFLSLSLLICKMEIACPPLKVLLVTGGNVGKAGAEEEAMILISSTWSKLASDPL